MTRHTKEPPVGRQLHSARAGGFTFTEAIHPQGAHLPWHDHDGPTICFVRSGAFREISQGSTLTCPPASLKFLPGGERHCNRFDLGEARGLMIEVTPERLATLRPYATVLEEPSQVQGGAVAVLARRICDELQFGDSSSPLALEGLVLELLASAAREDTPAARSRPARWVVEARDRIRAEPNARLGLSALAEAVGVHPVTLARGFRRAFGCSVGEYVRRRRVEFAAELLRRTDAPLAVVAAQAGFADQSHLSNSFRRHTGSSPSQFRADSQRS